MFNTKTTNVNYLAKIVKLPELKPHPNADRLQICVIDGNSIITGLEAKTNNLYIYFPLESAINKEYLSWSNSFTNPELNKDKTKKNFFSNSGRVKAVKLRGSKSEGYIVPITDVQNWLISCGKNFDINDESLVNQEFDCFDEILICEKYINRQELIRIHNEKNNRKGVKKERRFSKIIDDQFRLSQDVSHLGRCIKQVNPEDIIVISNKIHGCNFSVAKVLCKKKLGWHEKALRFCGLNIVDSHYDVVYASRSVIKNKYSDKESLSHFYDSDIWKIVADKLKDSLLDGISIYGEIGGYTPSGSFIQKKYDYNCNVGELDFYVFRITYTNPSGHVFEFSWQQIKDYCNKFNIKHVPELYYGYAKDLFNLPVDNKWHENFLVALSERFLEKDCDICRNKVPAEGIVLVPQSGYYTPFKHKSFLFKTAESKALDTGEVDLDTQESVNNESAG